MCSIWCVTCPLPASTLPDGIGGRLYHETEGLPLFLAAYLEALAQSEAKGAGETWPVPRGVADLLQARLDAVEETARQALQAAAVIGRSFDLETLQATSGRSDEEIVFCAGGVSQPRDHHRGSRGRRRGPAVRLHP